ncbi:MAG: hypothetical protein S4CHLAM123_10480 [Chlamydiales bacterium]|nr:hypothetical protein [Chlamydiales bacterium]
MKKERNEVRNLILMLSSAIFIAFVVVVGFIYYLGSSGTYILSNILVSPETLERVSFSDYDSQTGKQARFVFNKIEFVRADMQGKDWGRFAVSPQSYAAFYKQVSSLRSLPKVTDEMVNQFDLIIPSTLTILAQARDNEGPSQGTMIFQQVEFIDGGDLFRLRLHSRGDLDRGKEEWIYFRSRGIYKKVIELFAPPPS